jgi:hypothetical protein
MGGEEEPIDTLSKGVPGKDPGLSRGLAVVVSLQ